MSVHLQPTIRALEEARENANLIVVLDSQGVVVRKADEAAGLKVKSVPKITINAHGVQFIPS